MDYFDPLSAVYWLGLLADGVLLPLAQTEGQVIEIMKDPGFAQWVVYLLVAIYVLEKVVGGGMRLMGVSLPVKRDISGTVTTVPEKRHADADEVDALKRSVEALRAENQAQHQAAAVSGQNRVTALSTVLDAETTALSEKIDAVRDRVLEKIDEGFKTLTENMNAIALKSERHDAMLPPLVVRVQELERKHSESVGKIHERINDFLSKQPTNKR